MKSVKKSISKKHRGAVLVISMILIVVLSALAVSISGFSGVNLQIASNQRKAAAARACAESGLQVVRYWLNRVAMPGDISPTERFDQIVSTLQSDLTDNGITNVTANYANSTLTIPTVTLNSANNESFYAVITPIDTETFQLDITGQYGSITRKIRVNYVYGTRVSTVFDFGIATKGPLSLAGNVELNGTTISVEASVYIESDDLIALSITGNSQIAGDVSITNSLATVYLQGGQAAIGGETVPEAYDHVFTGVPPTEFPTPNPSYFEQYITNVMDSNTDTTSDLTLENIRIPAGTNPHFTGNVNLMGIIFIEQPNVVTFAGNATVTGIIVGDGDLTDNSGTNQISFQGNVSSYPVTDLPEEEQYEQLRDETGTFMMAPGFELAFGGNFDTLNGAIAGNGIRFHGKAGGTIGGSILNYSDEEMSLRGDSNLKFNRSGVTEVPAGFVPELVLQYSRSSFTELSI